MSVLSECLPILHAPIDASLDPTSDEFKAEKKRRQEAMGRLVAYFKIESLPRAEQGPACVAIGDAVEKFATDPVDDPEEFIRRKIKRARRQYHGKELSRTIPAAASTNSSRKKKGQRLYPTLKDNAVEVNDRWGDKSKDTYLDVGGPKPEKPVISDFELFDALKLNEHETDIFKLRREGYSLREVADQLDIAVTEVKAAEAMIAARAKRAGF